MGNDYITNGEKLDLLRDELGIDYQQLKFEKEKCQEAARLEAARKKAEAEAAREAEILADRHKRFVDAIKAGTVRVWVTGADGNLAEVFAEEDLVCPGCGERPDPVQGVIDSFAGVLARIDITTIRSWTGVSLGTGAHIKATPAFRVSVPCKCGLRATYAAVYLPETEIE